MAKVVTITKEWSCTSATKTSKFTRCCLQAPKRQVIIIMPRPEAYGSYAEGGATEVYCNRAVCQSVRGI